MTFESGEKVGIKYGTFHNNGTRPHQRESQGLQEATFEGYMPGRKYAHLLVRYPEGYRNIRVNVEDLEKL